MMELSKVTEQEFSDWLTSPVTIEFLHYLKSARQDVMDNWARGFYTSDGAEGTAQVNAEALGKVRQLDDLITSMTEE